jgi:hypothetical protein
MPIPPSIVMPVVEVTPEEGTPECPGRCLRVEGGRPWVSGGGTLFAHPIDTGGLPLRPPASVTLGTDDALVLRIEVAAHEMPLRLVLFTSEGMGTADLLPWSDGGPGPWPVVPYDMPDTATCVRLESAGLDFGALPVGRAASVVVDLRNACGVPVMVDTAAAAYQPDGALEPTFEASTRTRVLEAGRTSGVVVSFWPTTAGDHTGLLAVNVQWVPDGATLVLSLPLRGTGVLP